MERMDYDLVETAIATKDKLRQAEGFLRFKANVLATYLQHPASGNNTHLLLHQFPDWALLNVYFSRLSRNQLSFRHFNLNRSDANHTNKAVTR